MPSSYTSKYKLSQWKKSDQVLMEDFNRDNQNIENALIALDSSKIGQAELNAVSSRLTSTQASIPKIEAGTYTGTGSSGSGGPSKLTFPFVPKLVALAGDKANVVILPGQGTAMGMVGEYVVYLSTKLEGATLTWYVTSAVKNGYGDYPYANYQLNAANVTYHYFIIG